MPSFGTKSEANLAKCHPKLQQVLRLAIKKIDFSVNETTRSRADQERAFREGNTLVHYPNSAHNQTPSVAADLLPYPFKGWQDHVGFMAVALVVLQSAHALAIPLRWGGDWDRDGQTGDESFVDLPHMELHPWRDWASGKLK